MKNLMKDQNILEKKIHFVKIVSIYTACINI